MKNRVINLIICITGLLTKILPCWILAHLGKFLGRIGYLLANQERKTARNNILKVKIDGYSRQDKVEIIKECFEHFGQFLLEFFLLPDAKKSPLEKHYFISGKENLRKAFNRKKGVIIYTAHFGNWEWLGLALVKMGYPVNAIVADQPYLNSWINNIRRNMGLELIKTGFGIRQAYKILSKNELLVILGDQHAGLSGIELDFLGRPASVYRGVVHLAAKTGACVVPTFIVRKDFARFDINIMSPIEVPGKASSEQEKLVLKNLLQITEKYLKKHPEQWNWIYKRWKLADKRERI